MSVEINFAGLSNEEVKYRKQNGFVNKSKFAAKYSITKIVIENSLTAFNLINITILSILLFYYLRTGDYRLLYDSIGVISVTIFNTAAGIYQKIKAAKALEEVELMQKQRTSVVREGILQEIENDDIVKDDIVFIEKGNQIPVDGRILESNHLQIDESMLTGEALPQDKIQNDTVLSGSYCVYGNGYMIAEKVGDENYAAQVTLLAKKYKLLTSPLMKKINWIFFISLIVTLCMVGIEFLITYITGEFTVKEIRKISTIAFSLIPEGLVFFATVTFTIGIFRLSKLGAIVQKINAVDAFSTIKVVCMDKTGTLTKNNIKVAHVTTLADSDFDIQKALGSYCRLSTDQNATIKALEEFDPFNSLSMIDEIPFRSELKLSVIRFAHSGRTDTFVFGAFDILVSYLDKELQNETISKYNASNLYGYRNLLFGIINIPDDIELDTETIMNYSIQPYAIVSLKDETREDAKDALALFDKNFIELKILSGDSNDSVIATLNEINKTFSSDKIITGPELDLLPDNEFAIAARDKSVFARLKPEHKLRIVKALRKQKIHTAFIGDGVNDLPAIKEADLGITMEDGSQISKQVSDIVLLKNKFTILPNIFSEGNKIINTVKFVSRLYLTKNNTIFLLSLLSWFFSFTYPLTPRTSSLISVLGVGIPCYLIALFNSNSKAYPSFFRDLFIYVSVASTLILATAFSAYYSSHLLFGVTSEAASKLMLSSLVILMIFNFYTSIYHDDSENKSRYLGYAVLLFSIFLTFTVFELNFIPLSWLRKFYELDTISAADWLYLLMSLLPGAIIFFLMQNLRHQLMERYFYKNLFVRKF